MIKLSKKTLIGLFKLASLGKQIGGLIHNINGPLQNLGLDIEMINYSLKSGSKIDEATAQNLRVRLKRMEEEFERVNAIIRICSVKAEHDDDMRNSFINLNDYLEQELSFLQTNLNYKHNVKTKLLLKDSPPSAGNLPEHSFPALSWFLQIFIEELEREKINGITLKTEFDESHLTLIFSTQGGSLSEQFIGQLNREMSSQVDQEDLEAEEGEVGILLVLILFTAGGIIIKGTNEKSGSKINIIFPIKDKETPAVI